LWKLGKLYLRRGPFAWVKVKREGIRKRGKKERFE
jgi:hypothetical protein